MQRIYNEKQRLVREIRISLFAWASARHFLTSPMMEARVTNQSRKGIRLKKMSRRKTTGWGEQEQNSPYTHREMPKRKKYVHAKSA